MPKRYPKLTSIPFCTASLATSDHSLTTASSHTFLSRRRFHSASIASLALSVLSISVFPTGRATQALNKDAALRILSRWL